MLSRRPVLLPAEDKAVAAIVDQHDDGRVEPWEMFGTAVGIGAFAHMAGFPADRRTAADTAELMPRVPLDHRPRIDEQSPFLMPQQLPDSAHIAKLAMLRQRRVFMSGEIGGEMRDFLDQSQKDDRACAHQQPAAGFHGNLDRRIAQLKEVLGPPDRYDSRGPVLNLLPDPVFVGSEVHGAVDPARGVKIRRFHGRDTATRLKFVQSIRD